MFINRKKAKVFWPIVRFDSVKMVYNVPLWNYPIGLHPNFDMFSNISVVIGPGMIWAINHHISTALLFIGYNVNKKEWGATNVN